MPYGCNQHPANICTVKLTGCAACCQLQLSQHVCHMASFRLLLKHSLHNQV